MYARPHRALRRAYPVLPTTTTAASTTSTVNESSSSTSTTPTSTSTTSTTGVPIFRKVTLTMIDDCASEQACTDDFCSPYVYHASIAIGAIAPDGTFSLQLDLGDGSDTLTCSGSASGVCPGDGPCLTILVATCKPWQHVIVDGRRIQFLAGSTSISGCNDVHEGLLAP